MSDVRPWILVGQLFGCLAVFVSAAGLLCGLEATRSVLGIKLVLGLLRGVAGVFGLVFFVAPMFICFGAMMHIATSDADLLTRPEDEQWAGAGRAVLGAADYLFGVGGATVGVGDYYHQARPTSAWTSGLATMVHLFALSTITLIYTNLLIAITGDAWDESVLDAAAWRRFGLSAFASAATGATSLHADSARPKAGQPEHGLHAPRRLDTEDSREEPGSASTSQEASEWPAVLAWIKPESAEGLFESVCGEWKGKVVAVTSEVERVGAAVAAASEEVGGSASMRPSYTLAHSRLVINTLSNVLNLNLECR